MEIPYQRLSQDTLRRVIQEFVLREGTDYGHEDISIERKIQQVLRQLQSGEAALVFDLENQSFNIIIKSLINSFMINIF